MPELTALQIRAGTERVYLIHGRAVRVSAQEQRVVLSDGSATEWREQEELLLADLQRLLGRPQDLSELRRRYYRRHRQQAELEVALQHDLSVAELRALVIARSEHDLPRAHRARLQRSGLVVKEGDGWRITAAGRLIANQVSYKMVELATGKKTTTTP